jgi:hypothetical protein
MTAIKGGVPPTRARPYPPLKIARNGAITGAVGASQLSNMLTMLSGRRVRQHFSRSISSADAYVAGAGPRVTWRTYLRTTPWARAVRARVGLADAPNTYRGTGAPAFRFRVDGVALEDHVANYGGANVPPRFASAWEDCLLPMTAGALHYVELEVLNGARPLYCAIYEDQETYAGDDLSFGVRANDPITSGRWQEIAQRAWDLWRYQGSVHFAWCTPAGDALTVATATLTNMLDGSTAGWSSGAAGFPVWPRGRGRQFSQASSDVLCWAYAASSTTGQVVFKCSTGTIATISGITTAGWYSAQGTLPTASDSPGVVTVEYARTSGSGGASCSIYAAGMFDHTP